MKKTGFKLTFEDGTTSTKYLTPKPFVKKVEGPYNDKDQLLEEVELGQIYYYKAILNVSASSIDPSKVTWAVGYDTEKYDNQYKLFSGKEVIGDKVRISISIGGSNSIKEKINETFKIYAYTGTILNTSVFVEVQKKSLEVSLPALIARSMRRAGTTKDKSGANATREDITNLGFSLPVDRERLKTRLESAFYEVFPSGSISKRNSRVEYALKQIDSYTGKTDDKLFSIYQNDMDDWATGELDDNLVKMISFFKTNTSTSTTYEDARLTDAIAKHSSTTNFINSLSPLIGKALMEAQGDLSQLEVSDDKTQFSRTEFESDPSILGIEGLQELNSLTYSDKFSGLGISVDGTQAYNIKVTEYELNGNTYSGELELEILDHFGLDSPDILKDYLRKHEEFICWYILQHIKGYKPFITKILIKYSFKGSVDSGNLTLEKRTL